jgi:signal transduction histidine kinase/ActR/RegA family two-component response regulator
VKRLLALFVVLSFVPLGLLTYLSVHLSSRAVSKEATGRVSAYAGQTVAAMQSGMTNLSSLLSSYALRPAFREAFPKPDPATRTRLAAQLRQLDESQGGKLTLLLLDEAGRTVAAEPTNSPLAQNSADQAWFRKTLQTKRPGVSEAYRDRSGRWVIATTTPIQNGGTTIGMLVAVTDLSALQAYADYFAKAFGVQLTIVDHKGAVLAHPPGAQPTPTAQDALVAAALAGRTGVGSRHTKQGRFLTAYAPIPGLGWAVTAAIPNGRVYQQLDALRSTVYTVAAVLCLVLLAGLVFVARTLRQRQRAEDAAAETRQALEQARIAAEEAQRQAEQANSAKSQFLSRMSHELRTPLNAVLGFGQLLEMDTLTNEQDESVEQIMKAGQHLLGLINEVLDISRIEAGALSLSLEPVDLAEALDEAVALVRPLANQAGITISTDQSETSCYVSADRQRLKQVLLNLLSNAVKYNRRGGTVDISLTACDDTARLEVKDSGEGIAPDKLDKLFQPFERLGADLKQIDGTGLGLVLSKGLIEAMGGQIGVNSNPGGSTFWIELTTTDAPLETALGNLGHATTTSDRDDTPTATVLYIEDNLSNLKLIARILEQRPEIRLISAMQGSLGLELAHQHQPKLILLDLHLPDTDGEHVLAKLRSHPATADTPVIVLSADATDGRIQRLRDHGANDYLSKPIDVQRFLHLLDQHTRQSAAL